MSVAAVACGCNGSRWQSARTPRNTRCERLAKYGPELSLMLQSGKRVGVCNTRINKVSRAGHPRGWKNKKGRIAPALLFLSPMDEQITWGSHGSGP